MGPRRHPLPLSPSSSSRRPHAVTLLFLSAPLRPSPTALTPALSAAPLSHGGQPLSPLPVPAAVVAQEAAFDSPHRPSLPTPPAMAAVASPSLPFPFRRRRRRRKPREDDDRAQFGRARGYWTRRLRAARGDSGQISPARPYGREDDGWELAGEAEAAHMEACCWRRWN